MSNVLAVLLTLLCTVGSAQTPKAGDDWLVLSLEVVKTTDLVPREKIDFVTDPKFWPVDINGEASKMQSFLLGLDPATSDDKLGALKGLLKKPTQLQITVSHDGNLYRGWCLGSSEHILGDLDIPKDLQPKLREPCGQLVASYVGKTLPTWPLKSATPNLDGWFVGVKVEREFLRFLAVQDTQSYGEVYVIWSVDPVPQRQFGDFVVKQEAK